MKHLLLLSGRALTADEQHLLNFVAWMGVPAKPLSILDGVVTEAFWNELRQSGSCLAMSAATLAGMSEESLLRGGFLHGCSGELLIFGCSASATDILALSRLTGGMVRGLTVSEDTEVRFHLPQKARALSQTLAGLSFVRKCCLPGENRHITAFDLPVACADAEPVLTANDRPTFVSIQQGAGHLFLLASEVPDIHQSLDPEAELVEYYDGLIPVLIFLRHCFGDTCWHGPESTARLIIDDPTCTERYGFLDFAVLLDSMRRWNYGTSVAFIPWNYWRTSRRTASKFFGENSRVSLCVHGCDHTNKEFDASNGPLLGQKAALAMERMEAHRKRTGVNFDPVMVFPQGIFSTAAISALAANHYLAAVNTTCFPTDNVAVSLRVGDFLRPAITRFNGFPIFKRHYPQCVIDFAFDLFLGKPVLVVEHHEYFRDGCALLEDFVQGLYQLEPTLSWPSLADQLSRSCMIRAISESAMEVRFFTRQFQFRSGETSPRRLLLHKHEPDPSTVEAVFVDGSRVPFSFENEWLKLEVEMTPRRAVKIEVAGPKRLAPVRHFGMTYNAGVLLRRSLSEFRDNTLVRHRHLLKLAKEVARSARVTGK
jgi:hypothetical protein